MSGIAGDDCLGDIGGNGGCRDGEYCRMGMWIDDKEEGWSDAWHKTSGTVR